MLRNRNICLIFAIIWYFLLDKTWASFTKTRNQFSLLALAEAQRRRDFLRMLRLCAFAPLRENNTHR
ncbi:MAG: hypothetical protein B6245_07265 [Desulfobacteraceae bacterium 4572_88]|nr:MAG: hypothetical protein B6245_07265 [Desulfobacteraceae bacterium 4572_88]